MSEQHSRAGLTGNHLKLLAALFMLIDHMGLMLFPQRILFRVVGRLAYPIFAFMIAEGCRHTKNKLRYFLCLFGLGAVCQTVYGLFSGDTYLNILLTFSLSVPVIYAVRYMQSNIPPSKTVWRRLSGVLVLTGAVAGVWVLCRFLEVDYGFWGVMTPVLAGVPRQVNRDESVSTDVLLLGLGLVCLSYNSGWIQAFSLLALPLLMLYNGKRGKPGLKFFFYLFYPIHLVILEGIRMLLD